jgi:DNA-binding NarL/FixJ family response regulator
MTAPPAAASAPAVPRTLTVLLVDDHAVVREGYRRLLADAPGLRVIGEAGTGDAACLLYSQLHPDLVVMDVSLPDFSGIEALRRIRASDAQARVLMFSMHDAPIFATRALQAGAGGYLTKASAPDVLVQAVRQVAAGARFLSHDVAQALALQAMPGGARAAGAPLLSSREIEVLRLLVRGEPVQRIAEQIGLNAKTVANYQSAIKQKLGADTPARLVHITNRMRLLDPDEGAEVAR